MAILIYSSGISGGSADAIVGASRYVNCGIGMRLTKKPVYWRLEDGKRKYMYAMPILEELDTYVIRYGWRGVYLPAGTNDLQDTREKRSGMHIAANKLRFRQWAIDGGIAVPLTWVANQEPEELPLPILGRPLRHRKGREYYIYETLDEYHATRNTETYYSHLLRKTGEYRVFVFEGYVWAVSQKNPAEDIDGYQPWNFALGNATFKLLRYEAWPREVCRLARDTCHNLGLLFGGVDIIIADNGAFAVEVNNAPGIDGELKTRNFGILVDDLIERWSTGEKVGSVDPSTAGRVRHPALKGR